jgi:hypothetical protein
MIMKRKRSFNRMKQYRIAIRALLLCVLCALMLMATACAGHKAPAFADLDFTAVDPSTCTETDKVTNYVKISVSITDAQSGEKTTCEDIIVRLYPEVAPETVIVGALEGDFNMVVLSAAVGAGLRVIGVSSAPLSKISTERYLSVADNILTSGGLLISERGENSAAVDQSLYPHHRLIAGICRGVVAVESGEIEPVARYADGYGRTLLALPGRVTDSMSWGTNRMIATSMAQMVCTPRDVVELLELE